MAATARLAHAARLAQAAQVAQAPARADGWRSVLAIVAAAWSLLLLGDATGVARLLHHHALISPGGPPLWQGAALFLGGWLVMVAAMMLPASMPAVRVAGAGRLSGFLAAYAAVWLAFGLAAFVGDVGVHGTVHATPWLLQRPWLISVGVLAIAGAYQLAPPKHRALDACRDPLGPHHGERGFEAGWRHAADCLRSSWALMLVMFAAGFSGIGWMLALTAVMGYEAVGRHGRGFALAVGGALLLLAGATAFAGLTTPGVAIGPF